MKAVDFPTEGGPIARLDAAKGTLARFVRARADDLVGLVRFANYPDLDVTPTLDQATLLRAIGSIRPAGAVNDGTNMGDAIILGLGAIRHEPTRTQGPDPAHRRPEAPAIPSPLRSVRPPAWLASWE